MDWAELREIVRDGISLGAHSATHPRLTSLSKGCLQRELVASREKIEDRTGVSVTTFSYPYGESDESVRRHVAREYCLACGTGLRFLEPADNPFDLPRLDAFYFQHPWTMRNLLGPGGRAYVRARGWMRSARLSLAG
jgi:peptidoglycan/xylan/chitin deacetylase (PgdA/CDA1 family)